MRRTYVAYFGRPADPGGLDCFAGLLLAQNAPTDLEGLMRAAGNDAVLRSIIEVFSQSAESQAMFDGDNGAFIDAVYQNLFARAPDAAGKAYWAGLLNNSQVSRASAAVSILSSARTTDINVINNKVAVAKTFTQAANTPVRSAAYPNLNATAVARTLLAGVNFTFIISDTPAKVENALCGLTMSSAAEKQGRIGAGRANGMVIKNDGTLASWGLNSNGEAAFGDMGHRETPSLIGSDFVSIALHEAVGFGVKSDGSPWRWGTYMSARQPQAGGTNACRYRLHCHCHDQWAPRRHQTRRHDPPYQMGNETGFVLVAVNDLGGVARKADGSIWTWGKTYVLGDGGSSRRIPAKIGVGYVNVTARSTSLLGITTDGTLMSWGLQSGADGGLRGAKPTAVLKDVMAISCFTPSYIAVLKTDGSLWVWTLTNESSTFLSTPLSKVGEGYVAVAAGDQF